MPGPRGVGEAYERNDTVYSRPHASDSRPMAEGMESSHGGVSFAGSSTNLVPEPGERAGSSTKQLHDCQDKTAGSASGSLILSHSMLAPPDSVNLSCPAIVGAASDTAGDSSGLISQRVHVRQQASAREAALSTAVIAYTESSAAVGRAPVYAGGNRNTQPVGPHALATVTPRSGNRTQDPGPMCAAVQPLQLSRLSPSRLQGNMLDVSRFEDAVSSSACTAPMTDSPTYSTDQQYFADNEAQAASPTPSSSAFTAPCSYLSSRGQELRSAQSGSVPLFTGHHGSAQQSLGDAFCSPRGGLQDPYSRDFTARHSMSPQQPTRSGSGAQEPQPHCDIFPALAAQASTRTIPQQVLLQALGLGHIAPSCSAAGAGAALGGPSVPSPGNAEAISPQGWGDA